MAGEKGWDGDNFMIPSTGGMYGARDVIIQVLAGDTAAEVSDGEAYFVVPMSMNNYNLTSVAATVVTAGTTGTMDIQINNTGTDMLSTKITIDSGETDTSTAATPAVIDTLNDDVAGDLIRIDVDAVHTTPAAGLIVSLVFEPQ